MRRIYAAQVSRICCSLAHPNCRLTGIEHSLAFAGYCIRCYVPAPLGGALSDDAV